MILKIFFLFVSQNFAVFGATNYIQWAISQNHNFYAVQDDIYLMRTKDFQKLTVPNLEELAKLDDTLLTQAANTGKLKKKNTSILIRVAAMKDYSTIIKKKDSVYHLTSPNEIVKYQLPIFRRLNFLQFDVASSQIVSLAPYAMAAGPYIAYSPSFQFSSGLPRFAAGLNISAEFFTESSNTQVMINDLILYSQIQPWEQWKFQLGAGKQFILIYQQKDTLLYAGSAYSFKTPLFKIIDEIFLRISKTFGSLELYKIRTGISLIF